jgi:hypothetical protein
MPHYQHSTGRRPNRSGTVQGRVPGPVVSPGGRLGALGRPTRCVGCIRACREASGYVQWQPMLPRSPSVWLSAVVVRSWNPGNPARCRMLLIGSVSK